MSTNNYGRLRRDRMGANNFTQISNDLFRDERISFKAKGMFGLLSTHQDGYGVTAESLARQSKDGIAAVKAGLIELERFGYLERVRERGEDGRLGTTEYFISDCPECIPEEQSTRSEPETENRLLGSPAGTAQNPWSEPIADFPPVENPPVENRRTKNTNYKNTNNKNTNTPSLPLEPAAAPGDNPGEGKGPELSASPGAQVMLTAARTDDRLRVVGPALRRFADLADALIEGGWTPEDLHEHLTRALPEVISKPVGFIASRLSALPSSPVAAATATTATDVQAAPVIAWCGECDEPTRMIELPDGRMQRCATCSPAVWEIAS